MAPWTPHTQSDPAVSREGKLKLSTSLVLQFSSPANLDTLDINLKITCIPLEGLGDLGSQS